MNDQKQHWNTCHKQGHIDHYSEKPTDFAEEVLKIISRRSTVLDLGCGEGNDSVAFAKAGHTTIATDFSDIAITKTLKDLRIFQIYPSKLLI